MRPPEVGTMSKIVDMAFQLMRSGTLNTEHLNGIVAACEARDGATVSFSSLSPGPMSNHWRLTL